MAPPARRCKASLSARCNSRWITVGRASDIYAPDPKVMQMQWGGQMAALHIP